MGPLPEGPPVIASFGDQVQGFPPILTNVCGKKSARGPVERSRPSPPDRWA
jgi:hypothetical protein